MEGNYIYLFVLDDLKSLKIGKSKDVINRHNSLKKNWGKFNLEESYLIKCNSELTMNKLEKTIHFIFKKYNIEIKDNKDGYSEFFTINCINNVLDLIKWVKGLNDEILEIKKNIHFSFNEIKINMDNSDDINKSSEKRKNNNLESTKRLIKNLSNIESNIKFFSSDFSKLVLNFFSEFEYEYFKASYKIKSAGFSFDSSYRASDKEIILYNNFKSFEVYSTNHEFKDSYDLLKSYFINLNKNINLC